MAETLPARRLDLDHRLAPGQIRIGDQFYPLAEGEHLGVLHAPVIMGAQEGEAAVEHQQRQQMLQIDVRHGAVIDDVRFLLRHLDPDPLDIGRLEAVLLDQRLHRVERRLDGRAYRPFLDVGGHDLEARAEPVDQKLRPWLRRKGEEEIARAGEDVVDPGEAGGHHGRRRDAVSRRHAGEIEGLLDMALVARPAIHPRRLLGGIGQHPANLIGAEPGQRAARRRGAEQGREAVGAVAGLVKLIGAERKGRPGADVVAKGDGVEQRLAASPFPFRHRQRRRHDGAAEMTARGKVGIVGLIGVGRHGVGQRRVARRRHDIAADDHRFLRAAEAADIFGGDLARPQCRARDDGRQCIEKMEPGLRSHLRRQRPVPGGGDIAGERADHRPGAGFVFLPAQRFPPDTSWRRKPRQ